MQINSFNIFFVLTIVLLNKTNLILKLNNMNLSELKINRCYNHKTLGIVKLLDKQNLCFIDTLGYYHLINLNQLIN